MPSYQGAQGSDQPPGYTSGGDPTGGGGGGFDYMSLLPLLLGAGSMLGSNTGTGGFFGRPEVGQVPNLEPPGWQNLRSMLLGNLAQQYFGYGYNSRPNTGVLGFPGLNLGGGAPGPTGSPPPGPGPAGPPAPPTPYRPRGTGGGGAEAGGRMRFRPYAGETIYAGRRLPGRPRPPWQMQSTVPQTQPGVTPAYAGEFPEPIATSPFLPAQPATTVPSGPTVGGAGARLPGRTYAGNRFQPSPGGTPQFGKQPRSRSAMGTPDFGMGHNLLRMLTMLKSPPATRTSAGG